MQPLYKRAGPSIPLQWCFLAILAMVGVLWAIEMDVGSGSTKLQYIAQPKDGKSLPVRLSAQPVSVITEPQPAAGLDLQEEDSLIPHNAEYFEMTSSFQCINGLRNEHHVCVFHNMVLYDGRLFYIARDAGLIPQTHIGLLNEPPIQGQFDRIQFWAVFRGFLPFKWEDVEVEHVRQDSVLAVIPWSLNNFYHIFADYAASLHNTVCKYYGHCTFASRDKLRIFLQAGVNNETLPNWPPTALEAYSCISQWPAMPLSHPDQRGKVMVFNKLLAGIGPDCRARKFCNGPDSPWGRGPAPVDSMLSWRHRLAECLAFDDTRIATSAPPNVLLVDRTYSAGRHMLNVQEVLWRLQRQYGKVALHYLDGMSLREQAQLFSSASIVVQVHGAAIANWVFLPINAVAVHISHQHRYYGIHDWAQDMVRDLAAFNITYVPATNTNATLVETKKDHLFQYKDYWDLSDAQRLAVLEQAACPAEVPKVFQPMCAFMWVHLHSNLLVDFGMLDQAMETAMMDLQSKTHIA